MFDILYKKFKITKPIRLIELFGGYGSQRFALKYLGANVEHWKLCEWAVKSIQAYKDCHHYNDHNDYSKDISKEELIDYLFNKGISQNYNEPMNLQQIKRLNEKQLRTIYNNIVATKNLVNIQQVKGSDLEIVDTDKYDYIMTYSFPCQDLSLAGKQKGMSRDSGTRSGMLWEVERILDELYQDNKELPQILIMENVPEVKGTNNVEYFNEWQLKLEQLGYKNYHQNLIATDYGIPQTRNRTFMISILGDYSYTFPQPIPLKLKLKDLLEYKVDEKYYVSDKLLNHIIKTSKEHIEYTQYDRYNGEFEQLCRIWKEKSPTLHTKCNEIKIYEATKKGYVEVYEGDSINLEQPNSKTRRGRVGNQVSQTLLTNPQIAVVEKIGNYSPSGHNAASVVNKEYAAPTVMENHGTITATQLDDLRIRKLTPRECFRLMGVKDDDFERIAKNQSDSSLYHLAGDSIVVNVLMAIFKELL